MVLHSLSGFSSGLCLLNFAPYRITLRKEKTMSYVNVIRAWKDADYRLSLSEAERALLPDHPAGLIELDEAVMNSIAAGEGDTAIYFGTVHCGNVLQV